jgi:hypothetical protein
MVNGANLFTSLPWFVRGFYSLNGPYLDSKFIQLSSDQLKTEERVLEIAGLRLVYGENDFDYPERKMSLKYRAIYALLRRTPRPRPFNREWKSSEEYKAFLKKVF